MDLAKSGMQVIQQAQQAAILQAQQVAISQAQQAQQVATPTFTLYNNINLLNTSNTKQDIIKTIKDLENNKTSHILFIGYDLGTTTFTNTIDSTTFVNPKYILYRSNINFNEQIHPSSGTPLTPLILSTNNYALKIYAYITINTPDTYTISNTDNTDIIKLYINGYLILDSSITNPINTADIYLKEGNYLIYIEKKAKKDNKSLSIN